MDNYFQCAGCGKPVQKTYFCGKCRIDPNIQQWKSILQEQEREYRRVVRRERQFGFYPQSRVFAALAEPEDTPVEEWVKGENALTEDFLTAWARRERADFVYKIAHWAYSGGLSPQEYHALQVTAAYMFEAVDIRSGAVRAILLPSSKLAEILSELEGAAVSAAAYRKRLERARQKIQQFLEGDDKYEDEKGDDV